MLTFIPVSSATTEHPVTDLCVPGHLATSEWLLCRSTQSSDNNVVISWSRNAMKSNQPALMVHQVEDRCPGDHPEPQWSLGDTAVTFLYGSPLTSVIFLIGTQSGLSWHRNPVCWWVFINLTWANIIRVERSSAVKMLPSNWPLDKFVGAFSWLSINMGTPSLLVAVWPLGKWSWASVENYFKVCYICLCYEILV